MNEDERAGNVSRMGEIRNVYKILAGKTVAKKLLGRTRLRLMDNIKMDLREIRCEHVDWGSCSSG
jgi:hypothetical protein